MADNKQYIVQRQKSGAVLISEDVISAIVTQAVVEVDGVIALNTRPGSDVVEQVGKKNRSKGMKVVIEQDNTVTVSCNVTVLYGTSVIDVANSAQEAIRNAIESMAGVKVASVNVNVCAIVRK